MIYHLLLAALVATLMARRRRRRRTNFASYMSGAIDFEMALGTLNGNTSILQNATSQAVVDTTRISSIRCVYSLSNWTPSAGKGPIVIGVSHSDYAQSEVDAWIETAASWDQGDLVNTREVRQRLIRQIGVFDNPVAATDSTRLNFGRAITTKLNWKLAEGDFLNFWAYNSGAGNIATTDPKININGKANLWFT